VSDYKLINKVYGLRGPEIHKACIIGVMSALVVCRDVALDLKTIIIIIIIIINKYSLN
jgi:hypothetical protein